MLYKLRPKFFFKQISYRLCIQGCSKKFKQLLRKIPTDHHFHIYSGSIPMMIPILIPILILILILILIPILIQILIPILIPILILIPIRILIPILILILITILIPILQYYLCTRCIHTDNCLLIFDKEIQNFES